MTPQAPKGLCLQPGECYRAVAGAHEKVFVFAEQSRVYGAAPSGRLFAVIAQLAAEEASAWYEALLAVETLPTAEVIECGKLVTDALKLARAAGRHFDLPDLHPAPPAVAAQVAGAASPCRPLAAGAHPARPALSSRAAALAARPPGGRRRGCGAKVTR